MENEDEALDLLLSLQSEEAMIPESPRGAALEDESGDGAAVLKGTEECTGISLHKVDVVVDVMSSSPLLPATETGSILRRPLSMEDLPQVRPNVSQPAVLQSGYCSDENVDLPRRNVSMAAFRDVVKDSLEKIDSKIPAKDNTTSRLGSKLFPCQQADVDQHSGLRIRDRLVSAATLTSKLCDLKFVRLQGIKLAGMVTNFKGSWATVGVLIEKGQPKVSAAGKNFSIWKLASLDGAVISIFLFGAAYTQHWKESAGAVFTVFSAKVRLDERSKESSLSVFNGDQLLKIGTSADYSVCKGTRTGGAPCTMVVNKMLQGEYCQYHLGAAFQKVRTKRPEINGGNLATAFSGPGTKRAQTVHVNTVKSPSKQIKYGRPAKHLNSTELRKVLSTADKVTSNPYSQGMRFLETRSQQHYDQEQKLLSVKQKASTKLAGVQKKARIPLADQPVNMKKFDVMELEIDELDDDIEHARMFFTSKGKTS